VLNYYVTLSDTNQFQFVCPIFNVKTKMKLCTQLRELVWMGKQVAVRKGCQACMRASKCPAAEIVRQISYGRGQVPDDYGSDTPVEGKLRKELLQRLAPIVVDNKILDHFGVPDAERVLIESASERMHKLAGSAPGATSSKPKATVRRARPAAPDNNTTAVQKAAATGDLAAALNAA
jgi:hypothetical protein